MPKITDYCSIVDETVNIIYHTQKVPVLGKLDFKMEAATSMNVLMTDSVDNQVLNVLYF